MAFKQWLLRHWWQLLLIIVGLVYISNITAGIFELIPDNIPLVGNLDEGLAGALVAIGVRYMFK
jgi:hypothetical protein